MPGERLPPGEELVSHHAERVEIHPVIDARVAEGLLGRHVRQGADDHADAGDLGGALGLGGGVDRLGHAEVGDNGVAVLEQDVVRLDVAMDDAEAVGVGQGIGDFGEEAHRLRHREWALARQPVAERFPLDQRHGEPGQPADLAGGEERDDVGMVAAGRERHLPLEPLAAGPGRDLGAQHLDHHPPPQPALGGHEDPRHPPAAQLALHGVGVAQGRLELLAKLGHAGYFTPRPAPRRSAPAGRP